MSNWNAQQANLAGVLTPLLQRNIGTGVSPYGGQLVAPVAGASQIQNQINSYDPNQFQGVQTGAINQALSGKPNFVASTDPQTTANYFQQAVANPAMRNYQASTAPAIDQQFAAQGGTFSTTRGFAHQRALSDMQANNANQLSGMQFQTQQQNTGLNAQAAELAANRQLQGVGQAQMYAGQPLYNAQQLSAALAPFQQNAQNQDAAAYQQWQQSQAYNNPYLQQIMAFLGQGTQSAYQKPDYTGQEIGLGTGVAGGIVGAYFGGPMGAIQGFGTGYSLGNTGYNVASGGGARALSPTYTKG